MYLAIYNNIDLAIYLSLDYYFSSDAVAISMDSSAK